MMASSFLCWQNVRCNRSRVPAGWRTWLVPLTGCLFVPGLLSQLGLLQVGPHHHLFHLVPHLEDMWRSGGKLKVGQPADPVSLISYHKIAEHVFQHLVVALHQAISLGMVWSSNALYPKQPIHLPQSPGQERCGTGRGS